ncbi:response regulator transcription factor [Clostridium hydrogeniformans]|uniref:response regulator transcription factor n=1 Tax=Clostridium hydrogeniformans TaxID=349933 RepID=UPI0004818048|nr:response regulator transcription factor [Clostridium hydrogeniformans]
MKNKNILIVDDERKIVEVIEAYLEKENYNILKAYNGNDALKIFHKEDIDLILLDLMLPDIKGEDICKEIREESEVPIIMLTAKVQEDDILNGFSIGSDDYITKPFSPRQLVARVNAVLKRSVKCKEEILSFNQGDLIIDTGNYEVVKGGEKINLTATEFKILLILATNNKVFTRGELLDRSMGDDLEVYDRVIDSHIKNIRQKIEINSKKPSYIKTVHGIGYKFGGE